MVLSNAKPSGYAADTARASRLLLGHFQPQRGGLVTLWSGWGIIPEPSYGESCDGNTPTGVRLAQTQTTAQTYRRCPPGTTGIHATGANTVQLCSPQHQPAIRLSLLELQPLRGHLEKCFPQSVRWKSSLIYPTALLSGSLHTRQNQVSCSEPTCGQLDLLV